MRAFLCFKMRETKSIQSKAETEGRTITGICSVFGNVDSWGDRMHPGSFTKTISEGRARAKHLWNHDFSRPPIASIKELKEITRSELPDDILSFAPDATGGLIVKREYYVNNELSELVFEAIKAGDISEMSFGFDPTKFDFSEMDGKQIREIREVKLFDTSDVLWGMNNATLAQKTFFGMTAEMFLLNLPAAVEEYQNNLKAGRRNAEADLSIIKSIHEACKNLGFEDCQPIEEAKSIEAEAAHSTSLIKALANLELLKTQTI